MRLFVAALPNEEILRALEKCQEELKIFGVSGRFAPRENLHLTFAFIGEYHDPEEVTKALFAVKFRPTELHLEGLGRFGDLYWAGIGKNPALDALAKKIRQSLAARNIPFDKKRFSPHITLVRKAFSPAGDAFPSVSLPKGKMTLGTLSLMRSDRGKHGMIYREIGAVSAISEGRE